MTAYFRNKIKGMKFNYDIPEITVDKMATQDYAEVNIVYRSLITYEADNPLPDSPLWTEPGYPDGEEAEKHGRSTID